MKRGNVTAAGGEGRGYQLHIVLKMYVFQVTRIKLREREGGREEGGGEGKPRDEKKNKGMKEQTALSEQWKSRFSSARKSK